MTPLASLVDKVRSKNAGPFWLTIDIFCRDQASFEMVSKALTNQMVAELFHVSPNVIKRFDIDDLEVIKFSLPRPTVQGMRDDRDMHGAGFGCLLEELIIDATPR
ncbi:MAG: DUF4387 family protein [Pseudomonadota bacterium]